MDPLTHTVVGASLARLRFVHRIRGGTAALVIGANVPDVDVFTYVLGADFALAHRRGWTHGPLGVVLLAALTSLAIMAWYKKYGKGVRPGPVFGLCLLGALSHPLLDWLNTYGVRLLYPFDRNWYYGDSLVIIDPWLWLAIGVPFLLSSEPGPWIRRGWLFFTSIAATVIAWRAPLYLPLIAVVAVLLFIAMRAPARRWRRSTTFGLVLGALWIAMLLAAHAVARGRVQTQLASETSVTKLMVGPAPARPWRWEIALADDEGYRWGHYELLTNRLELEERTYPLPGKLATSVAASPGIQGYLNWVRFPVYEIDDDGTIWIYDLRYVRTRARGFGGARVAHQSGTDEHR